MVGWTDAGGSTEAISAFGKKTCGLYDQPCLLDYHAQVQAAKAYDSVLPTNIQHIPLCVHFYVWTKTKAAMVLINTLAGAMGVTTACNNSTSVHQQMARWRTSC